MIPLVLLAPLTGFSQQDSILIIWHNNQTKYVVPEPQALVIIELFKHDSTQSEIIKDYKLQVAELESTISAMKEKSAASSAISKVDEGLIDIERDRLELEKNTPKLDRFQLIVSAQFGAVATYQNTLNGLYGGCDIGLKFKSGTYFSLGYMAGTSHLATVRIGQVIKLRKPKLKDLIK